MAFELERFLMPVVASDSDFLFSKIYDAYLAQDLNLIFVV